MMTELTVGDVGRGLDDDECSGGEHMTKAAHLQFSSLACSPVSVDQELLKRFTAATQSLPNTRRESSQTAT